MTAAGTSPLDPDRPDPYLAERPRLLGLAYRMLGTRADAEDIVQEAWLRWRAADQGVIERPAAWLTTVTTRLCLDRIRATERRREEYLGPWLPEPLVSAPGPEEAAELAESLTMGFLAVLDRLDPVARAVFLLADLWGLPFADVASTVGRSEAACRQIASRARRRIRQGGTPAGSPADRRVVDELLVALVMGDLETALAKLAPDAVCVSDGGPRRAARRPVTGAPRVARFLVNLTRRGAGRMTVEPVTVNGDAGVIVRLDGEVDLVAAFAVVDGRVASVWMFRNPEKLAGVGTFPAIA